MRIHRWRLDSGTWAQEVREETEIETIMKSGFS